MLFNSIEFAVFLPVVFFLYWFACANRRGLQNVLLLLSSYVFYGWWDWRFLSLIIFSSSLDYIIGIKLGQEERDSKRRLLLWTSICVNLGFLGFFKYFNFFAESFAEAFTLFGSHIEVSRLNIILPVGISFYTFQTLSYTLDIYNRKLEPTTKAISFFAFVSFFPQLVAGPIERASNLLPQFLQERTFDYEKAKDGSRQILWGLFKKVVIADNCAVIVNEVFIDHSGQPASMLILGAFLFAFQIYGDFSGYSDIAIGTARLFGFNLMQNFAFPYFSRDIAEFWRRWHISLSTWFRDYLYIPLGGSRGNTLIKVRNVLIIFLVSGFWHGANWTFIVWGGINALYFLPILLTKRNRKNTDTVSYGRLVPNIKELFQMLITFLLTMVAWVFFRADSVSIAFLYLGEMFGGVISDPQQILHLLNSIEAPLLLYLAILLILEWLAREQKHGLMVLEKISWTIVRWMIYIILISLIFMQESKEIDFIYFQF